MPEIIRKEIMRGVNLTCVPAYKFKTECVSVNFIAPLNKSTAALNAVLPSVLRRGTAAYPNMEKIAEVLDGLYGARISPVLRKRGEAQCIGFYADFADSEFIPSGDKVLEKTIKLMGDMILSPATSGGRLVGEYVSGERENLIDDINAIINDKRSYASMRLISSMCRGEKYGISKLGTLADASKISVFTLTRHYKELISTAPAEVFYCGASDPRRVEIAVLEALAGLPRVGECKMPETEIRLQPGNKVKYVTDKMDVTQGKLSMGFRLGKTMEKPDYAVLMVLNAVFGGAVTSKLFMNVREKLSLCYYAGSSLDRYKGIMVVNSGVDFDKYEAARDEILRQLEAVKRGEVEEWELSSARRTVTTALYSAMDEPSGIEDIYLGRAVASMPCTPEELAALAQTVTLEEIVEAATDIKLDTVYFMSGEAAEGES